jgi:hypothetical protein
MTMEAIPRVELIPVDQIDVVNPRARNKKSFKEIIDNIAELGLKKPITVTKRDRPEGTRYDLVCGQGRLEAYRILGQREKPHCGADRARRWEWRRTRSEPTRPVELSPAACRRVAPAWRIKGVSAGSAPPARPKERRAVPHSWWGDASGSGRSVNLRITRRRPTRSESGAAAR